MDEILGKVQKLRTSKDVIDYIKNSTFNSSDMVYREIKVLDDVIYVVYNESMTSSSTVSDFVIRSIIGITNEDKKREKLTNISNEIDTYIDDNLNVIKTRNNKKQRVYDNLNKKYERTSISIDDIVKSLEKKIVISKVKNIELEKDDIFYYIFSGFSLIIYNRDIIAVETRTELDRSLDVPTTESTVKGPKDAFIENYQKNIGLIRKRIKSEKLVLDENKIGRRSKTKVGLMYISDIAKEEVVDKIKKKLNKIDIDAILDSNYIMEILEDSNKTAFPTMISTERPDLVSFYLLQGRIAIVVDNSPFILVIPAFMKDFINSMEDYYQKDIDVTLTKIVRYIAFFITILTPAVYIALITFNQEAIPTDLLLSFVAQRKGVPFPAFFEAILMILSFEILREGDYRVPNAAGSTLSIVGALILGDAAVSAGIVSPIMIIVIAITTISGLMFADINMSNALRIWRLIFLLLAAISGLIGIGIATLLLITKISSTTSFTEPFSYPIAPINFKSIKNNILKRENISEDKTREEILTNNLTKYKVKEEK